MGFITGARADFGLMVPILKSINKSPKLKLSVYATSNHLMGEFGYTFDIVKKEFPQAIAINSIFKSDDREGMARFLGDFLTKITDCLIKNRPDLMFIPCDRVEAFATALACNYLGIPMCHIHGGERTYTADEPARHAITKLSHLHFAATNEAAKRIEKMGEESWRIYTVGAPVLDIVLNEKLPDRKSLLKYLGIPNATEQFILVTQHPTSEEFEVAGKQMEKTLSAVKSFNLPTVIVYPHADAGGQRIIKIIQKYKNQKLFYIYPNIEHKYFLALEREASAWVGNSSGGIIESASFRTPVVNIGIRQLGRQQSGNVINVNSEVDEIEQAIKKSLFDKSYINKIKKIKNIWGDGNCAKKVTKILEDLVIDQKFLHKQISY